MAAPSLPAVQSVLAGDIGGTSTRLALHAVPRGPEQHGSTGTPSAARLAFERYSSREFAGLEQIVARFLSQWQGPQTGPVVAAAFGVAGPSRDGVVRTPNLPWVVDAAALGRAIGTPRVLLVNDLVANAWGILALPAASMRLIGGPPSAPVAAPAAVVSAGTGLGEAGIAWDGRRHWPIASEGGHGDFAPRDDEEIALLKFLQGRVGPAVSWERVLSGAGLVSIYEFLRDTGRGAELSVVADAMRRGDAAAEISAAALAARCPLCVAALGRFATLYGAEAGNAALRFVAQRGVYLGGGIAPRNFGLPGSEPFIQRFMVAFVDKGRTRALLESIPVRVVLDDGAALLGAARLAAEAASGGGA
jgi:glucokinase